MNQLDVGMLVIETAFSNREQALAQRSLHLSPATLASELARIAVGKNYPIYITHTKPAETGEIMSQIDLLADGSQGHGKKGWDIRWLQTAGRPGGLTTSCVRVTINVTPLFEAEQQNSSHVVTGT